jgi:hypothetical protein
VSLYGIRPEKALELGKHYYPPIISLIPIYLAERGCVYVPQASEAFAQKQVNGTVTSAVKDNFEDFVNVVEAARDVPVHVDPLSMGKADCLF